MRTLLANNAASAGLLLFVMPTHDIDPPRLSQSVQFIDKNDAGSLGGGLRKKVADTCGSHAHEHLHKFGTTDAEERHFSLSGYGPGQKGFAGSRRSD